MTCIFWLRKQLRIWKVPTTLLHYWFLLDTMMMINAKVRLSFFRWSQSRKNGLVLTSTLDKKVSGTLKFTSNDVCFSKTLLKVLHNWIFVLCTRQTKFYCKNRTPLKDVLQKKSLTYQKSFHFFLQKISFRI